MSDQMTIEQIGLVEPAVIRAALAEHQRVAGIARTAMCVCGWEVPLRGNANPAVLWSAHFIEVVTA